VGRVRVEDLRVLDLTDPTVRDRIGVAEVDLVDDDLTVCQAIADEARSAGFDAILAPSAALPDETTLAVFRHASRRVTEEHSRIQRPPRTLARLLPRVRRRRQTR
jgi:RES domain-containing protein